jgi:hypothetical protein
VTKLIGYARVSTHQRSTDRQQVDVLAVGVRRAACGVTTFTSTMEYQALKHHGHTSIARSTLSRTATPSSLRPCTGSPDRRRIRSHLPKSSAAAVPAFAY